MSTCVQILCVGASPSFLRAIDLLKKRKSNPNYNDRDTLSILFDRSYETFEDVSLHFHCVKHLEEYPKKIMIESDVPLQIDMILYAAEQDNQDDNFDNFIHFLKKSTRQWLKSGVHISRHALSIVHIGDTPSPGEIIKQSPYCVRIYNAIDSRELAAKLLFLITEMVINGIKNPWVKRKIRQLKGKSVVHSPEHYGIQENALGLGLCRFMRTSKMPWMIAAYTGAVIASMVESIQKYLKINHLEKTVPLIHGNSEHSLACNALAYSQLNGGQYLIAVTIGMMLDFKGTLLNLVRSKSHGVIVCGEVDTNLHYGCQSMMTPIEDVCAILSAMNIPYVFMKDPASLKDDWDNFCYTYNTTHGPVVILATPRVLDATVVLPEIICHNTKLDQNDCPTIDQKYEAYIDIFYERLMDPNVDLLFIVDKPITKNEHSLLQQLSLKFSIGVADSVQAPGSVCKHQRTSSNLSIAYPHYLGTLGIYGSSDPVMKFLFEKDGKVRDPSKVTICFLNSLVDQPSSPYTISELKNSVSVFQVSPSLDEHNPHVQYRIHGNVNQFLTSIMERYKHAEFNDNDFSRRKNFITECLYQPLDPINLISTSPMSPNYFFHILSNTLKRQIQENSVNYVTVFDAGRFGFSALRSVPRIRPGFSGVFGRGAMGDALQSIPVIAMRHDCTIAFIGDGARALVPDVTTMLMRTLNHINFNGVLIILTGVNGTMSMIQTYQERGVYGHISSQVDVPVFLQNPSSWTWNGIDYERVNMIQFDPGLWRHWCGKRHTVLLVDVLIEHNNAQDIYARLITDPWWKHD